MSETSVPLSDTLPRQSSTHCEREALAKRLAHRIDMAMGREKADLLIENAQIVDVFNGTVREGCVAVGDGVILGFTPLQAHQVVNAQGRYLIPGLIDAHIHIESSMAVPSRFAELVLPHGTTTVIADPHEIANVHGLEGLRFMLEDSEGLPLNVLIAVPSCVPATPFEDNGAILNDDDIAKMLSHPRVVSVGELMNFPGVLASDTGVLAKAAGGLLVGKAVDGHSPGVVGQQKAAYLLSGVMNDHEGSTKEEALSCVENGGYVFVREGSAARNLNELIAAVTPNNMRRFAFCCDDRHAQDLMQSGHIDNCLRMAVRAGLDPIAAVTMATLNAAECFGLRQKGAIAPGRDADLVLVDDLTDFRVESVFCRGECVVEKGCLLHSLVSEVTPPANSVNIQAVSEEDFKFHFPSKKMLTARVIGFVEQSLLTHSLEREIAVVEGDLDLSAHPSINRLAVLERHKATGTMALALIEGLEIHGGALATSIAHDSHNIVVAGDSPQAMCRAVKLLIEMGGGIVGVSQEEAVTLALPVAGLMSQDAPQNVASQVRAIEAFAHQKLGVPEGISPVMGLSFMALPVIPHLKLTNRGLFDVDSFAPVSLEAQS